MKKLILIICLPFFLLNAYCQENIQVDVQQATKRVNTYLDQLEDQDLHGAVLVAYKDQIIANRAIGYSDKAKSIKSSPSTIYDIGSITKQFTGAAILKLEMQGKLSVKDKISKYFDGLPEDKKNITIHQLLTHSSGLPASIGDDYEAITSQEFMKMAMAKPLKFRNPSKYNYSNVGYSILAILIEKLSGLSYENYLYNNLWKPAGMEHTGYTRPNFSERNIAVGYKGDKPWGKPNEKKWDTDAPYLHLKGNGGVLSTTGDMHKWHQALLGDKILSVSAKEKYYAKHVEEGQGSGTFYGYGWAIFPTPRNTDMITHNGGNGIFFADMWRYLTEEITIITMTNSANRSYERIAPQIARIIIDPDFKPSTVNDEAPVDEAKIDRLVEAFIKAVNSPEKKDWQKFLETYATQNFLDYVEMEQHLAFFQQFHQDLKDGQIKTIDVNEDEISLVIGTKSGNKSIMIGYVIMPDEQVKFEGLMVD